MPINSLPQPVDLLTYSFPDQICPNQEECARCCSRLAAGAKCCTMLDIRIRCACEVLLKCATAAASAAAAVSVVAAPDPYAAWASFSPAASIPAIGIYVESGMVILLPFLGDTSALGRWVSPVPGSQATSVAATARSIPLTAPFKRVTATRPVIVSVPSVGAASIPVGAGHRAEPRPGVQVHSNRLHILEYRS